MERLLEKHECLNKQCGRSFLVDMLTAEGIKLSCPFCKSDSEAIANQNPKSSLETQLAGCLYPSV